MPRREYDKPLGPPQGLGKRGWTNPEGQHFDNVYTREFAHASVWVNVETRNGIIHWRAPADTVADALKSDDALASPWIDTTDGIHLFALWGRGADGPSHWGKRSPQSSGGVTQRS